MTTSLATRRAPSYAAAGGLLVVAGVAWLWVVRSSGDMGAMPGTMGRGLVAFEGIWIVMMAAMMLPATAPMASMYARSTRSVPRMAAFTAGYLGVWAAAGLPAYALVLGAARLVDGRPAVGTAVAAVLFAAAGLYQLSPLKDRCLAACRTPFGLLLRYASWQGRTRDLRAGAHHGAVCLGCCWLLMTLLAAFGLMNLWAMVGLAAVVVVEKLLSVGPGFSRAVGVAALALAVAVVFLPWLAPWLQGTVMSG